MQILLDTQVLLWFLADSRRLSSRARKLIVAAERVFVSGAPIWECCIKVGRGRIEIDPAALVAGMQPGDVPATFADTTLLTEWTGHKPGTPIRSGIRQFVQWVRWPLQDSHTSGRHLMRNV